MKVRARIGTLTDLFLGALHADHPLVAEERVALRRLLCDLTLQPELPAELERRIAAFDPQAFDLCAAAREFRRDPPMCARRLLELVAELCVADSEFDLEEDEYLRRLARALDLSPIEYEDIVLDYEVLDSDLLPAPRAPSACLRGPPASPRPPPCACERRTAPPSAEGCA